MLLSSTIGERAGGNTLHQRVLIECALKIQGGAKSVRFPRMRGEALPEIAWRSCEEGRTCEAVAAVHKRKKNDERGHGASHFGFINCTNPR